MRTVSRFQSVLVIGLLVPLTLLVLVPASPLFQKLPSWDSGIFLYTGWRVTQGELPYRDIWDHKPPLVFAVNALGVFLANGSRWGVWAVEVLFMLAAGLIGFDLIRKAFGDLPAVYVSVAWMVNAFVTMDGGNYTTEYALPLQFGLLWLVATATDSGVTARRAFVLGILSGLLFWLRQNDIGIPLAIVLLFGLDLLRRQRSEMLRALAAMVGGVLLVSVLVLLPFLLQGALGDFWQAAFLFNFYYIDSTWLTRLMVLRVLPVTLPAFGLTILAFMGWLIAALAFLNGIRGGGRPGARWADTLDRLWGNRTANTTGALTQAQVVRLLTLVLIALPLEFFFVILSGNPFDHYFLALLPVLAVLAGFTFRLILATLERAALARGLQVAFVIAMLLVLAAFAVENVKPIYQRLVTREQNALVNYLEQNTDATDSVMIWGGEVRVNFEAQRASPTRFVNLVPLRKNTPLRSRMTREMLRELSAHPPRLVIALANDSDGAVMEFPAADAEIAATAGVLFSKYKIRETNDRWTVYEYDAP